jgi:hypothetical protein
MIAKLPRHKKKIHCKMQENAGKCQKTPENATKHRKTPQIFLVGDKSSRDQIFGGAKKTAPFSAVEINRGPKLGGQGPLSPQKTYFLVSCV